MPISDLYVVHRLLQETLADRGSLIWREGEEGYLADINGIRLEFASVQLKTGSQLYITLYQDLNKVHISEPLTRGFLRQTYDSESHQELARLMKELAQAIVRQCTRREKAAEAAADQIREAIFRRLLFGESDGADSERVDVVAG